MSRPLEALLDQDLAWPDLADDPAHRSPVKVALSKVKYVHGMLLGGRKWVGKSEEQAYWQLKREEEERKEEVAAAPSKQCGLWGEKRQKADV